MINLINDKKIDLKYLEENNILVIPEFYSIKKQQINENYTSKVKFEQEANSQDDIQQDSFSI